uniref:Uncharacterized protein n=1 Tax=Lactuca sativa TaxID=4236 RepID=A0A9R1VFT5_LACSA|nr:hypothetical protein LSAT_V11C500270810 [Lactuca sativa]
MAIMSASLVSISSGPRSDVVVRVLDVFVIQACFVLCVPNSVPMQYAVYVFMLVDMFTICYVQLVSGLRSDVGDGVPVSHGLRSDEVSSELRSDAGDEVPVSSGLWSNAVSSGLRSDAGDRVPVSSGLWSDVVSGLRSDAVGKAQYVFICYCMVCGLWTMVFIIKLNEIFRLCFWDVTFKDKNLDVYQTYYEALFRDTVAVGDKAKFVNITDGKVDTNVVRLFENVDPFLTYDSSSMKRRGKKLTPRRDNKRKFKGKNERKNEGKSMTNSSYEEKLETVFDVLLTRSTQPSRQTT